MDISTLRLGMAHGALRLALGDELSPISFAQGSFAFIDRRDGKRYFCSAESQSLPIFPVLADGALGDANDPACLRMRAKAEPAYLLAWSSFARDYDRANATEARAQARLQAEQGAAATAASSSEPASKPVDILARPLDMPAAETRAPSSRASMAATPEPANTPKAPSRATPIPAAPTAQPTSLDDDALSARALRAPAQALARAPVNIAPRAPIAIHDEPPATGRIRRAPIKMSGGDRV